VILIGSARNKSGRNAKGVIRILLDTVDNSIAVVIPGTQTASDVQSDIEIGSTKAITGRVVSTGVKNHFEKFIVDFLSVSGANYATIAWGDSGGTAKLTYDYTSYYFDKAGYEYLNVNVAMLVYLYALHMDSQIYSVPFGQTVNCAPRRILVLGHSLGGGGAQLLGDMLCDKSFMLKLLEKE